MSLLGKILAIVNILAAGTLFFLAGMDYAKRQEWAYAVFRYDLAINGLPLDAKEADPVEGLPYVDRMNEKLPKQLGSNARTQEEALKQAQQRVTSEIAVLNDDEAKRQRIGAYLAALAENLVERHQALEQAANPETDVGEFQKQLERKFDECLHLFPEKKGDKRDELSIESRKRSVARLLFNLVPDDSGPEDAWTQRRTVLAVVGARAFLVATQARIALLNDMIQRQKQLLHRELTEFTLEYDKLVKRIYEETVHSRARERALVELQELERRHKLIVTQREAEVAELAKSIKDARDAAAKAIALQEQEEKELFELQRKIDQAGRENQLMERKIRHLEETGR